MEFNSRIDKGDLLLYNVAYSIASCPFSLRISSNIESEKEVEKDVLFSMNLDK